jgi:heptosyltransferase I
MPLASLTTLLERTRSARKLIVVDFGFLGDTVHLVPALWEIKRHYPQAELHVLTTPVGWDVLKLVPCVEQAWPVELDPHRRTWGQQLDTLRALRRENFDLAFNFSGADRTIFWTALAGARQRVAHAGGRMHLWNSWLIPNWIPRQSARLPVYEQRRQVLAACGFSLSPPQWDLSLPEESRQKAKSFCVEGAVHLSVCASSPLKEWPLENWLKLVKGLLTENPQLRIVATGSNLPRERAQLELLAAGAANERLTSVTGLSIAELAGVLGRCQLHVGADSGVLHLAVAVGLPTISIFRDYHDASAWMPTGAAHRVFSAPCVCVNQREQPCAASNQAACLAAVEVRKIAAAVREQLRLPAPMGPGHNKLA